MPYILRPWMKSLAEDPEPEHSSTAILSVHGQQRGKNSNPALIRLKFIFYVFFFFFSFT